MKKIVAALMGLVLAATPASASAEPTCDGACITDADMQVFVKLLRDQKCRNETPPKFDVDPITIVVDREGRIYGSGADPKPYKIHMKWCNYEVDATGKVKLTAASRVEPDYGFRFRPKFSAGLLPIEAFRRDPWTQAVDVALMADLAYWKTLNFNVHAGIRSFGLGVGVDITKNFGAYVGYANTWSDWRSNVYTGLYFGF